MANELRSASIKTGAFVLVAVGMLVAGTLWIAGSTLLGVRHVPYRVLMRESGAIQGGDRVRMAGVAIGKVHSVELRPDEAWPVVFHVSIREGVPIRADSTAVIERTGLLGTNFLEIGPGSSGAPQLSEGGEIHGTSVVGMEEAMQRAAELASRLVELVDQTSTVLDDVSARLVTLLGRAEALVSEENVEEMERILVATRQTLEDSGPRITTLLDRLDSVAASADRGLERVVGDVEGLVADVRSALGPDGERLARVLVAAEGSLESADGALSVLGDQRRQLAFAIEDLAETASNLKSFSQTIKERPFSLVRITSEPPRRPGEGTK